MQTAVLTALLLAAAATLPAQTFGEIAGAVTDSSSAVIAGAAVTVTNAGTNQVRRVETNQAGSYTIPFLVPGLYDVEVSAQGFKTATRKGVDLQVGDVARLNFTLELGAVTESIVVTGGAPLLTTDSTALGTVIENRRIVELPLNGRNYLQLIALSPNVTAEMGAGGAANSRQGGDRSNQSFSIGGQRQMFNRFTLDGVENTDVNFNTFIIRPSIEALQEFKVLTGVYSAEYGRATSQINVTTKPGSNQFHGSLFEFLRNDALDAKEWRLAGDKNPFRRNQFGFTLGGRLIRDRVFFLSNFEALRDVKTLQGTANVATDRMRSGDLSGQSRLIYDPLTRVYTAGPGGTERAVSASPFPGQMIPRNRIHPISLKLLEFYPHATVPGDNIVRNYVRQRPRDISQEQFTQRIDFNENSRSNWFGRFSWGDEYEGQLAAFRNQEGRITTKTYQGMLSNTRIFGPSVVNEFRFGYSQFQNDRLQHFAFTRDVTSELGIIGLDPLPASAWGTPGVNLLDGLTSFGESTEGPYISRNHTFQWLDNLSIVRGKHSFKLGGEARRDRFNQLGNSQWRGQFRFETFATADPARRSTTAHSFADFLLGEVRRSIKALGSANPLFRATSYALYAEDTWRITPRLTLNIGLRYENTPPYHDKYRGILNVQMFDSGLGPNGLLQGTRTPILTRPGSGDFHEGLKFHFWDGIPTQAGDDFIGRGLVRPDNNDFAPRLGIAYSPSANWSFRTGIGVFYSQDTGNPRFDMARNLPGRADFSSDDERPNSSIGDPWKFQRETFACRGWDGVCLGPPLVLANNVVRRTPYVFQWMFNVQRQLTENISIETGYQGNAGHKLERWRYYNIAIPRRDLNDSSSIAQRSPWPQYGLISMVDGGANSNYNAFSVKLQQRFSKGLTYLAGYTWSKALDNGSGLRTLAGDRFLPKDSYDLNAEYGLSQYHTGRRLVGSFIYELPFGAGKPFANQSKLLGKFVGGWQIGSILTFSDGTPQDVANIGDSNNTGEANFPDATGINPIPGDRSASRFWDVAAFDASNRELTVRYGNVGRNVLTGPGLRQWDFSLIKDTAIKEGHTLQFRFEAFNASNHPNWNVPGRDARNRAAFGVVQTARTMRETQFALKYLF